MERRSSGLTIRVSLSQGQHLRRDKHRARHRHLLQPSSNVGCLAQRGGIHVQIAPNGAHDDLARVQPYTDLQIIIKDLGSPELVGIARNPWCILRAA
jgi:hypothetical protein